MAEPASSIITIVTVTLAVVKGIYKHIKEISLVNDLIKSLLIEIKDLYRLIKVVESTYTRAGVGENRHPADFVGRTLKTCQGRLTIVKDLVFELAARESETWLQKAVLKGKSDSVKKRIEEAMQEIDRDMGRIRMGLSCWSLDLATFNQRILPLEAEHVQKFRSVSLGAMHNHDVAFRPLDAPFSDADTFCDIDSTSDIHLDTTVPRASVSSTSSQALGTQSDDAYSVASHHSAEPPEAASDWRNFYFAMTNEPIQRIRALLDTQPALATMANDCERTPLHLAAQRGNLKLAGILIEFGADVNARDSEKASVLDLAVEYNQGDFVELLMERGVEEKTLERNKKRFGEMKSGIRFKRESNDRTPNNSRRDSRTLSWAKRRGLSI